MNLIYKCNAFQVLSNAPSYPLYEFKQRESKVPVYYIVKDQLIKKLFNFHKYEWRTYLENDEGAAELLPVER